MDLQLITTEQFNGLGCNFYRNENDDILLTRGQIGTALEYSQSQKAIDNIHANHKEVQSRLDKDEVGRFDLPHPQSKTKKLTMTCLNESGLYSVIIRSDKLEAKIFRKWVTKEVLPSIRKTGSYSTNPNTDMREFLQLQQQQLAILTQNQQAQTAQLTILTTLITSTLPQPYKPPFTRWMNTTYKKVDIIAASHNQSRKQTLHQLYNELQDTYDIDLNEYAEEYCYSHSLQNTGIYTLSTISASQQLRQIFDTTLTAMMEQCYTNSTAQ